MTTMTGASEKQIAFVEKLMGEKEMPAGYEKSINLAIQAGMSGKEASYMIKMLLGLPKVAAANAVTEPGVYQAPDGQVYVAKWNKQKSRLYAKRLIETGERLTEAGTVVTIDFVYEAGAIYRLSADMKMGVEKAKALTVKYGRCIVCGKALKAAKSVEQGIGPVCIKSFA